MKLFFSSLFIILFATALFFWSMAAFTPASAHSIKYIPVSIQMKHGQTAFEPQPSDYYCTAKLPCLDFTNKTKKTITVHWHYLDPLHFQAFMLKPGQDYKYIPKYTNWHEVFRIIQNNQVGDELDVQTF